MKDIHEMARLRFGRDLSFDERMQKARASKPAERIAYLQYLRNEARRPDLSMTDRAELLRETDGVNAIHFDKLSVDL